MGHLQSPLDMLRLTTVGSVPEPTVVPVVVAEDDVVDMGVAGSGGDRGAGLRLLSTCTALLSVVR